MKGKGVLPATLGEPWSELAKVVQSYITCEGRKDVVRPRHLKLLAVLKGKCAVNLPALLNSLLHDTSRSLKKAHHEDAVVSHHGLIRLIVTYSLARQQTSWWELITTMEGEVASPSPKTKHPASTSETPKKPRESPKPKQPSGTTEQAKKRIKLGKQKCTPEATRHVEKRKELAAERRATLKRRYSSGTEEQVERRRRVEVEEQMISTPEQPGRPRKSVRLAKIRGRMEKIQPNIGQPIEIIEDPPALEQILGENLEQTENEVRAEEGDRDDDSAAETSHPEAAIEQPIREKEMEQLGGSHPQNPVEEEELATILASLRGYPSPSSPAEPPEGPSEEGTREKLHDGMAGEENPPVIDKENLDTSQEQAVPKTPEGNPPADGVENGNVCWEQDVPRMIEETLDERGAEMRATHVPTAEAKEIKKLRRKQQKLLNIIAQLRQKIRSLKASLRIKRTVRRKRRTNTAGSSQRGRQSTYRHLVGRYSASKPTAVPINTEEQNVVPSGTEHQNAIPIDIEEQADIPNNPLEPTVVPIKTEPQGDIPVTEGPPYPFIHVKKEGENRAVHTETPPSGKIN